MPADGQLILRIDARHIGEVKEHVASLKAECAAFRAVIETEAEALENDARQLARLGNVDGEIVASTTARRLREALK